LDRRRRAAFQAPSQQRVWLFQPCWPRPDQDMLEQ